jgi:hypothetical protein
MPQQPEPPWLLLLWLQCQEYRTLPHAGGVLDQAVLLLQSMQAAGRAYREHEMTQSKIEEALHAGY